MGTAIAMRKPYLVVGGDGTIGRGLLRTLRERGLPTMYTTRRQLSADSTGIFLDLASPELDIAVAPEVAFLCAAVTSIKACEENPQGTRALNVENTARLAEKFRRTGTRVVFLSTNAVFDGTRAFEQTSAPVSPKVEYGAQKADAERAVFDANPDVAVVRLTKVFSREAPLVAGWISALRAGNPIQAFSDLPVCPVSIGFSAEALLTIAKSKLRGIFHLSGERDASYAAFAGALACALNVDATLVQPVSRSRSESVLAYTPTYTSLNMSDRETGLGLRPEKLADVASALV